MGSFAESYLGRLRADIGSRLVLMPGSQVVVQTAEGEVLLQWRDDLEVWEIPAGGSEPGQDFVATAVAELKEEAGVDVDPSELVPFGTLSGPHHELAYPGGDRVDAYALLFLYRVADRFTVPGGNDGEARDHQWRTLDDLPTPLHPPTQRVLDLLVAYEASGGRFQVS